MCAAIWPLKTPDELLNNIMFVCIFNIFDFLSELDIPAFLCVHEVLFLPRSQEVPVVKNKMNINE